MHLFPPFTQLDCSGDWHIVQIFSPLYQQSQPSLVTCLLTLLVDCMARLYIRIKHWNLLENREGFWENSRGKWNKSIPPGIWMWNFLNVLSSLSSKKRLKTPKCLGQTLFGLHQKVKIPVERRHFSRKCTFNQNCNFPAKPMLTTAVLKLREAAGLHHLLLPADCPVPLDLGLSGEKKVKSFDFLSSQVISESVVYGTGDKIGPTDGGEIAGRQEAKGMKKGLHGVKLSCTLPWVCVSLFQLFGLV